MNVSGGLSRNIRNFNFLSKHFATQPATRLNTTIDVAVVTGDTTIPVNSTTNAIVGDFVMISGGGLIELDFLRIITVNAGVSIVVNRPIDNNYDIGAIVEEWNINLNSIVGSIASPIIYELLSPTTENWFVDRLLITMIVETEPSDAAFGDIAELTNGVVVREQRDIQKTITFWQNNGNMIHDMYDVTYTDRAGGADYGLRARWSFNLNDSLLKLLGGSAHKLEILVQDNIQAIVNFQIKGSGYLLKG